MEFSQKHSMNTPSLESTCLSTPETPGRVHITQINKDVPVFFPASRSIIGDSFCGYKKKFAETSPKRTSIEDSEVPLLQLNQRKAGPAQKTKSVKSSTSLTKRSVDISLEDIPALPLVILKPQRDMTKLVSTKSESTEKFKDTAETTGSKLLIGLKNSTQSKMVAKSA